MKTFSCHVCGQMLYFDNARCLRCGSLLGYLPDQFIVSALEPAEDETWRVADGSRYRLCSNTTKWQSCNWMIPAYSENQLCASCSLTETIPDLSEPDNLQYWRKLERGKRWLVYNLMRLGLPVTSKTANPESGLAFEFLREPDAPIPDDDRVMTGHINGKITVNVVEADDLERERIRLNLNEVYRSILGHFRHESGHYYWWYMVSASPLLETFRKLFGDDRRNYDKAMATYYRNGPRKDWQSHHISAYASSHPWEDWAECWAHYLTIVDALETANSNGVLLSHNGSNNLFFLTDSYRANTFDDILEEWLPLTYAVNSINRSAGQNDLYPFILPGAAIDKFRFIHDVIKQCRNGTLPRAVT